MSVEITEQNFNKYFFQARPEYKPEKGQVLVRWRAAGDFIDGFIKRNVIEMLCKQKAGAETARQVMKKLVNAQDKDAVKVLREIAEDLVSGMSVDEVFAKPYHIVVEQFFWTKREYVPEDPHWEEIKLINVAQS